MPKGYELRKEDEVPKEERHTHTIMASNFFAGIANFMQVQLPERWRLETGRSLPEVNRTRMVGENLWVVDGDCTYVMYDEGAMKAYELHIFASEKERRRRPPRMVLMKKMTIGGHEARVEKGEVYHGFLRRRPMPMVSMDFSCPYTSRLLRMELRGRLEGQDLDAFLDSLRDLVCH